MSSVCRIEFVKWFDKWQKSQSITSNVNHSQEAKRRLKSWIVWRKFSNRVAKHCWMENHSFWVSLVCCKFRESIHNRSIIRMFLQIRFVVKRKRPKEVVQSLLAIGSQSIADGKSKITILWPRNRSWCYNEPCVFILDWTYVWHFVELTFSELTCVCAYTNVWSSVLQVGFGKNGTLFALTPGRVVVTAETINPNWEHTWIQRIYAGREDQRIWKKHFNVIPFAQHNRFRLIDEV